MPTRDSYVHGIPSWVDLMTTDVAEAKAFYSGLFGWEYEDVPAGDDGSYTMVSKDGHLVAGLGAQAPEQAQMGIPPMWNTYVTVDDIEASTKVAASAGGQVMMPAMDVMEAGRMAVIVDPTGAVVCLWQALQHPGAGLVNEHGALIWNELTTSDVPGASAFYNELFGWTAETMPMPEGDYTVFAVGDAQIAGAMNPPMEGIPNNWGVYFGSDDADATAAAATSAGGQLLAEPFDSPPGRIAVLSDPMGSPFNVMSPTEPPS